MFFVMQLILFFFNDTATTEIYTLSLHDALPISTGAAGRPAAAGGRDGPLPRRRRRRLAAGRPRGAGRVDGGAHRDAGRDRKSTRLNSSHANISYAVFCLKKKKLDESEDTHATAF